MEYIGAPLGTRYNSSGDRAISNRIASKVRRAADDITRVSGASNVSVYAYRRIGGSELVLHLVNYEYDPTADRFKRKRNINVRIKLPPGQYEAQWIRPGDGVAGPLPLPGLVDSSYNLWLKKSAPGSATTTSPPSLARAA